MQDVMMARGSPLVRERRPPERRRRRRAVPVTALPHVEFVPRDRAPVPHDRAPLSHPDAETRHALREATLIVEQAALHAQTLAALLDDVRTALTALPRDGDCADSVGLAGPSG